MGIETSMMAAVASLETRTLFRADDGGI